jgi:iron(III) transport system ATP-binding protein
MSMLMAKADVDCDSRVHGAVSVQGAQKVYGGRRGGTSHEALADVSLEVAQGEMLVLLGPSGCGKTTLLRMIAGLEDLTAGTIALGGQVVSEPERGINVPPNKRNVGFVFQSYALWPHMRVRANVAYPLRSRGVKRQEADAEAARILESLDCGELLDRYPAELSGGQQQRIALARSLVGATHTVLFDEPLSNIDAQLRHQVRSEIRRLHAAYKFTGIYVTHDQREAIELGDRIAVIRNGRIGQIDVPAKIYRAPADAAIARFFGVENALDCSSAGTRELTSDAGPVEGRVDLLGAKAGLDRFWMLLRSSSLKVCSSTCEQEPMCREQRCVLRGGVVTDVVFAGERSEILIDCDGVRLIATRGSDETPPVVGGRVDCHFLPEDALLYPHEAGDGEEEGVPVRPAD